MKIVRDGKEYELTEEELHDAYKERKLDMYKCEADYLFSDYEDVCEWARTHELEYIRMVDETADMCMEHEEMYDYCSEDKIKEFVEEQIEYYLEEVYE